MVYPTKSTIGIVMLFSFVLIGCNDDDPVGPEDGISFSDHVLPIFQQNHCLDCHGAARQDNNLRVDSVPALLEGGVSGPAVIPGDAENSLLIQQMSSEPPLGNRMPFGFPPVSQNQQNTIRTWINEGAQDN